MPYPERVKKRMKNGQFSYRPLLLLIIYLFGFESNWILVMQQKEENTVPVRKGIGERIMDCLSQSSDSNVQKMISDEEKENDKLMANCLRENTRSQLSVAWNNYRYKKWGGKNDLPSLEELEMKLKELVPQYSAL